MILRNKKTGGLIEIYVVKDQLKFRRLDDKTNEMMFNSLAELNLEWEDYKKPKEDGLDRIITLVEAYSDVDSEIYPKEIVEKLKAWKRLQDKGFRFCGWATNEGIRGVDFEVPDSFFSEHNHSCISDETRNDLDLLFGGEE